MFNARPHNQEALRNFMGNCSSSLSSSSSSAAGQQDEGGVPVLSLPTAQQGQPGPEQQLAQDAQLTNNQESAQYIQSASTAPPLSDEVRAWLRRSAGTGPSSATQQQVIRTATTILSVRNSGPANASRTGTASLLPKAMDYGTRTSPSMTLRLRDSPSAAPQGGTATTSSSQQRGRASTRPKEGSKEARRWVPAVRCASCEDEIRPAHYERSMEREDRLNTISIGTCPICKEELNCPRFMPCGHLFCAECLRRWFVKDHRIPQGNDTCPSCREPMLKMEAAFINDLYRGPRRGSFSEREMRPEDLIRLPDNDEDGELSTTNGGKTPSTKHTTVKKTAAKSAASPAATSTSTTNRPAGQRDTSSAQRDSLLRANTLATNNFRDSIKLNKHLIEAATKARNHYSVQPDTAAPKAWDQTIQRHARQIARTEEVHAKKVKETEELQAMTREQFRAWRNTNNLTVGNQIIGNLANVRDAHIQEKQQALDASCDAALQNRVLLEEAFVFRDSYQPDSAAWASWEEDARHYVALIKKAEEESEVTERVCQELRGMSP